MDNEGKSTKWRRRKKRELYKDHGEQAMNVFRSFFRNMFRKKRQNGTKTTTETDTTGTDTSTSDDQRPLLNESNNRTATEDAGETSQQRPEEYISERLADHDLSHENQQQFELGEFPNYRVPKEREEIVNYAFPVYYNKHPTVSKCGFVSLVDDKTNSLRNAVATENVLPSYEDGRLLHNKKSRTGLGDGLPLIYRERQSLQNDEKHPVVSGFVSGHVGGNISSIDKQNATITSNYNSPFGNAQIGTANMPTIPKHNQQILNTYSTISSEQTQMGKHKMPSVSENQRTTNLNKEDNQVDPVLKPIWSRNDDSSITRENRPTLNPNQMPNQQTQHEAKDQHSISLHTAQEPSECKDNATTERKPATVIYDSPNFTGNDPPVIWFVRRKKTTGEQIGTNKSPKSTDDTKGAAMKAFVNDQKSTQIENKKEMPFSDRREANPTDIPKVALPETLKGTSVYSRTPNVDASVQQENFDKSSNVCDAAYDNVKNVSENKSFLAERKPSLLDRTYAQQSVSINIENPLFKMGVESIKKHEQEIVNSLPSTSVEVQREKKDLDSGTKELSTEPNGPMNFQQLRAKFEAMEKARLHDLESTKYKRQSLNNSQITSNTLGKRNWAGTSLANSRTQTMPIDASKTTTSKTPQDNVDICKIVQQREGKAISSTKTMGGVEFLRITSADVRNIPSKEKQWSLGSMEKTTHKQPANSIPEMKPNNNTCPQSSGQEKGICNSESFSQMQKTSLNKVEGKIDLLDTINGQESVGLPTYGTNTAQPMVAVQYGEKIKSKEMPSSSRNIAVSHSGNKQPCEWPKKISPGKQTQELEKLNSDHVPVDHVNSSTSVMKQVKDYFLCGSYGLASDRSTVLPYDSVYEGGSEPSSYGEEGHQTSSVKHARNQSSSSEYTSEDSIEETRSWKELPIVGSQKSRGRKSKRSGGSLDGYLPSGSSECEDLGDGRWKSKDKAKELETLKKPMVDRKENRTTKASVWMVQLVKTIQQTFSNTKADNVEESRKNSKDSMEMKQMLPITSTEKEFSGTKRQYSKAHKEVDGIESNVGHSRTEVKKKPLTSRLQTSSTNRSKVFEEIRPQEESTFGESAIKEIKSNIASITKTFTKLFSPMTTKLTSPQKPEVPQPSGTVNKTQTIPKLGNQTELGQSHERFPGTSKCRRKPLTHHPERKNVTSKIPPSNRNRSSSSGESTEKQASVSDSLCSEEYDLPHRTHTDYAKKEDKYQRKPLTSEEYQSTTTEGTDSDCQQVQPGNYPDTISQLPSTKHTVQQNKCVSDQRPRSSSCNSYDTVATGDSTKSSTEERIFLTKSKTSKDYADQTASSSTDETDDSGEYWCPRKKSLPCTETLPKSSNTTRENNVPSRNTSSAISHGLSNTFHTGSKPSTSGTTFPLTGTSDSWRSSTHYQNVPSLSMSISIHEYDTPYTTDTESSSSCISVNSNSKTRLPADVNTHTHKEATPQTHARAHHVLNQTREIDHAGDEPYHATKSAPDHSTSTELPSKKDMKTNHASTVPCRNMSSPKVECNTSCSQRDELRSAANSSFFKGPVSKQHIAAPLLQVSSELCDNNTTDSKALATEGGFPLRKTSSITLLPIRENPQDNFTGQVLKEVSTSNSTTQRERENANTVGVRNETSTCGTLHGHVESTTISAPFHDGSPITHQQTTAGIKDIRGTVVECKSNLHQEVDQLVPGRRPCELIMLPFQAHPGYDEMIAELQYELRRSGRVEPPPPNTLPPSSSRTPPTLLLPQQQQGRSENQGTVEGAVVDVPMSSVRAAPDHGVISTQGQVSRSAVTTASPHFKKYPNVLQTDNVENCGFRGRHFLSLLRKTKKDLRRVSEMEFTPLQSRQGIQSRCAHSDSTLLQVKEPRGTTRSMSYELPAARVALGQSTVPEREHVTTLPQPTTSTGGDPRRQQSMMPNDAVLIPNTTSSMLGSHKQEIPSLKTNDTQTRIQPDRVSDPCNRRDQVTPVQPYCRRPTAANEQIRSTQVQHRTPVDCRLPTPFPQNQPLHSDNRQDHTTPLYCQCRQPNADNELVQEVYDQHRPPPRTVLYTPIQQRPLKHNQLIHVSSIFGQRKQENYNQQTEPIQEQDMPPAKRAISAPSRKYCPIHSQRRPIDINFVPTTCRRHSTGNVKTHIITEQQTTLPAHSEQRYFEINFVPENRRRHRTGNEQHRTLLQGHPVHSEQRREQSNLISGNCRRDPTGNERIQSIQEQRTIQNVNNQNTTTTNSTSHSSSQGDMHDNRTFSAAVRSTENVMLVRNESLEYRMSPTPLDTIAEEDASTSSSNRRRISGKVTCQKSFRPDLLF